MWVRVPTPPVPRPIWGVDWSDPDRLLVLGGGGLVELLLAPAVGLRVLAPTEWLSGAFDPDSDTWLSWEGTERLINGPNVGHGKDGHPNGDRIVLDENDELAVADAATGAVRQVLGPVRLFDGEDDALWSVSDFTDDYRHIVSFDADELRVFRQGAVADPGAAADPPKAADG